MFGPPVFVSFLQTGLRGQVNGAVLSVADKTRTYCICHGGAGTGLAPSVLFGLCLRLIALSYLIVFSCPRPIPDSAQVAKPAAQRLLAGAGTSQSSAV
jgi:hypothetical protein